MESIDPDSPIPLLNTLANVEYVWGMPSYMCWVIIAILLFLSMLFSACENAYSLCNKFHFKALAEKGKLIGKVITKLVDKFDNTLITVLIGNNAVATLMSSLCSILFYQICQNNNWGGGVEILLSTVIVGFLCYIIGDTIPKVISKALPNQIAILMAYPIIALQYLLYPLVFIYRCILSLLHKLFKIKDENLLSKQEILEQIDDAVNDETMLDDEKEKEKLFENDEKEIISHVMSFDERKVSTIYTPLDKTISLNINGLTCDMINEKLPEIPYSRVPIYDDEKDNIIGILVLRTYFQKYVSDPHLSIPSILEQPVFVYSDDMLDDAFESMNSNKNHLAIVKNRDEKVIGILSMGDVLEEVVDDIDEDLKTKGDVKYE